MNETLFVKSENSPARIAVGFCQVLRGLGLEVPVSRVQLFVKALGLVGLDDRDAVYWAGRSTLVADPEEIQEFDRHSRFFGKENNRRALRSNCHLSRCQSL